MLKKPNIPKRKSINNLTPNLKVVLGKFFEKIGKQKIYFQGRNKKCPFFLVQHVVILTRDVADVVLDVAEVVQTMENKSFW